MEIVLIAAVDKNLAIGKDGKIPWEIKEDLKFFREKTEDTAIIMAVSYTHLTLPTKRIV